MYANPFRPDVCVVLSLAVYLWCVYRDEGSDRQFQGVDHHKRYYNTLIKVVNGIPKHVDLGCQREEIGTHSARKFGLSHVVGSSDSGNHTQACHMVV